MIVVESGQIWAGIAGLVITQVTALVRDERRAKAQAQERARQESKASEERVKAEEKASLERRRVMQHLRSLRPDKHCAARGCPLAAEPLEKTDHLLRIAKAA